MRVAGQADFNVAAAGPPMVRSRVRDASLNVLGGGGPSAQPPPARSSLFQPNTNEKQKGSDLFLARDCCLSSRLLDFAVRASANLLKKSLLSQLFHRHVPLPRDSLRGVDTHLL